MATPSACAIHHDLGCRPHRHCLAGGAGDGLGSGSQPLVHRAGVGIAQRTADRRLARTTGAPPHGFWRIPKRSSTGSGASAAHRRSWPATRHRPQSSLDSDRTDNRECRRRPAPGRDQAPRQELRHAGQLRALPPRRRRTWRRPPLSCAAAMLPTRSAGRITCRARSTWNDPPSGRRPCPRPSDGSREKRRKRSRSRRAVRSWRRAGRKRR
jgi:hypothetical protein